MDIIDTISTYKQETAAFGDSVSDHVVPARPFLKPLPYDVLKESWSDEPRQEMPRQMTRPAVLANFNWTNSQSQGQCISAFSLPGGMWTALKKARLNYFAYGRFNFRVRVVLNGMRMNQGKLMVVYNPYPIGNVYTVDTTSGTSATSYISLPQLTNYAHFFLDPSDNRTGEISIPFVLPVLWRPLFSISDITNPNDLKLQSYFQKLLDVGTLSVYVMAPLNSVSGAINPINVAVYGWLEDVSLALPVDSSDVPTSANPLVSDIPSPERVVAQVGASKIKQEEAAVSHTGPISAIASGIGNIASLTANLASSLSLCKPAVIDPALNVVNRALPNPSHGVGAEPTNKLTLDPQCNIECGDAIAGTAVDEMDIKYIGRTYSYRSTIYWSASDPSGAQLTGGDNNVPSSTGTVNIYPRCVDTRAVPSPEPQPMSVTAHLLNAFQYYKGGSRIKVQAVCTPFHSGRVVVVFVPFGLPIPTTYNTDSSDVTYSAIIDLSGRTEIEFEIPYCAATPVLATLPNYLNAPASSPAWSIGQLQFYVLNKLVSSASATPDVQLLVYHSFCDDLEVYGPTLAYASNQVPFSNWVAFPSALVPTLTLAKVSKLTEKPVAQVGEGAIPNDSGASSGEQDLVSDTTVTEEQVTDHSLALFRSATRMGFASKYCFGERIENLGQLIKRSVLSTMLFGRKFTNTGSASSAASQGTYAVATIPVDHYAYGAFHTTTWSSGSWRGTDAVFSHSWMSYFSLIYRFRAGGMRFKVACVSPTSATRAPTDTGAWTADAPTQGVLVAGLLPQLPTVPGHYKWSSVSLGNLPSAYASSASNPTNRAAAISRANNFRLWASATSLGSVVSASQPNLSLDFEVPHYSFAMLKPSLYASDSFATPTTPQYSNTVAFMYYPSNFGLSDGVNSASADPRTQFTYMAPNLLIYASAADDFRFHGLAPPCATVKSTDTTYVWSTIP